MALYHSVKGENNYTIVGTPTIVDGVVSGFGSSNYLSISQAISGSNSLEVVLQLKNIPETVASSSAICSVSGGTNNIVLRIYENTSGRIVASYVDANGTTVYFAHTTNVSQGFFKFSFTSTTATESYSSDGNVWTLLSTGSSAPRSLNANGVNFGYITSSFSDWGGSIDLKGSYIKVDEAAYFGVCPILVQKHQLRGPEIYTTVGTPTLTDGIASGFSDSDYFYTNSISEIPVNFKMATAFTAQDLSLSRLLCSNGGSSNYIGFTLTAGGDIRFGLRSSSGTQQLVTSSIPYVSGTKYYVKAERNNTALSISVSTDKVNWTTDTTTVESGVYSLTKSFYVGVYYASSSSITSPFSGSIDLNETYIQLNGKLWLWQPRETEKIVVNGVEVWTKPVPPTPVQNSGHTLGLYHFEDSFNDEVTGNAVTQDTSGRSTYQDLINLGYSFVDGKFGKAFNRGRGGSAGTLANHNNVYADNFTIDYWTKNTDGLGYYSLGNFASFPTWWESAQPNLGILFNGTGDGTYWIPGVGATSLPYSTYSQYVNQNDFNHVAVQKKDTKFQLYVNGHLVVNADCPQALPGIYIDFPYQNNSGGYFDEIRFSDIARYNGDFTPETQPYGSDDFAPTPDWDTYWQIPDGTPDKKGEGIYGPFARYKYLSPITPISSGHHYDLVLCIKTPSSQSSNQALMGITNRATTLGLTTFCPYFFDNSDGSVVSVNALSPSQWYYIRVIYNSINGVDTSTMYSIQKGEYTKNSLPPLNQWQQEVSGSGDILRIADSSYSSNLSFGGSAPFSEFFLGWIDFNNSYLREIE